MVATFLSLEQQHKDNYLNRLPIFPYMELANPKSITPEMDRAIEKVTKVVALHPKSQWTDDCYLLVGKAQFLKKDYEAAEETLRFMVDEFNPDRPKNSKSKRANLMASTSAGRADEAASKARDRKVKQKEREEAAKEKAKQRKKAAKEKAKQRKAYNKAVKRNKKRGLPAPKRPTPGETTDPKKAEEEARAKAKAEAEKNKEAEKKQAPNKNGLKHQPVYQEGVLWLARTLVERGNEESALRMLQKLQENPALYIDVQNQMWPVLAHLYLKRNQPTEAILPLENAIASARSRNDKARFAFVLAQIQQEAGNWKQASDAFQQVIDYATSYPMAFRARLNLALNKYKSGVESSAAVAQQLEKLLRDPKNAEYKDQIHFTLAEIALNDKDRPQAIEQFQQAVRASVNNPLQKGEAYYSLAQLYLETEEFVPAKLYLDSTLSVMAEQDKRFKEISGLRDNLTDIAIHLVNIAEQDSLLKLSNLTDEEKKALASALKKAQDAKRLAEISAKQAPNPLTASNRQDIGTPLNQGTQESTFFAYNDRDLKRGERDFQDKWGTRVLQDNWRRSSNTANNTELATDDKPTETNTNKSALLLSQEELDQIFANVPKTDADRRLAEFKIAESMYKLGVLYRERLGNNQKSIQILEQLQSRFPNNNFELDTWFNLYLSYKNLADEANAKKYADLLIDKYPATKYAQAIQNPNFKDEMVDKISEINRFYDQAYGALQAGDPQKALDLCQTSRIRYGVDNPLLARFALLSALCIGKLQGKEAYIQALSEIIAKHPNTDEQKQAREILRVLGGPTAALPGNQQTETDEGTLDGAFTREDDQLHYILVVGNASLDVNEAKVAISDYNRKFHKLDKLSLTNMFIGADEATRIPLIIIRRFDNRSGAMKYYEAANTNPTEFIPNGNFELLAISLNNYRELIRQQSVAAYRKFFDENY